MLLFGTGVANSHYELVPRLNLLLCAEKCDQMRPFYLETLDQPEGDRSHFLKAWGYVGKRLFRFRKRLEAIAAREMVSCGRTSTVPSNRDQCFRRRRLLSEFWS